MTENLKYKKWEILDKSAINDPDDEKKSNKRGRRSECLIRETKNIYRKAFSETQILDLIGMECFKDGFQYNFMTGGDIDSLSYLKAILRHQKLDYCLFSTWCMASDDIMQFEEWLQSGQIKKLDAYLGEIFPSSYPFEWKKINEIFDKYQCGRIAVFRNHSKIYAGYGNKFYFGVQTSANINTNPRAENGCITIGKDIYDFYKDYFDKIISIVK
jgi:hypothetical protein